MTILNTSELIPNNWSYIQIAAKNINNNAKRLMINWHDVTKDHLENFNCLIKEKSEHRKLNQHINDLELLEHDMRNDEYVLHTYCKQPWQVEIDKV